MKSIVNRTFETPFELIAAQGRSAQAISYTTDEHRASVEQFLKAKTMNTANIPNELRLTLARSRPSR